MFPTLLNEVQNKGRQGVRARYGAELPPIISIVRYPGRPVILGMDQNRYDIVDHAGILVHHNAAMRNAAGCTTQFFTSQFIPPFLQRHRCDALPCFSASPVTMFYIAHIAFPPLLPFFLSPQYGLLYKTRRDSPRVTTQRYRHWQRGMAIANANANAAMRCTKAGIAEIDSR